MLPWRRLRRLEQEGFISSYATMLSAAAIGLPILAYAQVSLENHHPESVRQFDNLISELPEVLECHRATGTDCYVMKVVLASMDHLQTLLDKLVMWGSPVTSIVISSPVPGRGIQRQPIPPEDGG